MLRPAKPRVKMNLNPRRGQRRHRTVSRAAFGTHLGRLAGGCFGFHFYFVSCPLSRSTENGTTQRLRMGGLILGCKYGVGFGVARAELFLRTRRFCARPDQSKARLDAELPEMERGTSARLNPPTRDSSARQRAGPKERMGWPTGLEPATASSTSWDSTIELRPPSERRK